MSNAKLDFIQNLQPNYDLLKVVKHCIEKKIQNNTDAYHVITRTNINEYNRPVSSKALLSLYETAYDLMYDYIKNLKVKQNTSQTFKTLKKKFEMKELKKNPKPQDCKEFFFETCPKILGDNGPVHAQKGFDPIDENGNVFNDFIHVYPFEYPSKIDCRLYLNTTPENSCKIGELLLKESYKKHMRVYFKFDTSGLRNDTMLLYTSYEHVNDFVQILEEIKQKHPQLFVGAEKAGLLTARVSDCVSYGEEPEYTHSSFNSERCDAIDNFVNSQLSKARMSINSYNGVIQTSKGEKLVLRDYIIYRLRESFMETLAQTQEDIKKKIYPENLDKKTLKSYIEIQNNIFSSCQTNMPQYAIEQIEKCADRILNNLKFGARASSSYTLYFKTTKKELFSFSEDYIEKQMKTRGYLEYPVTVQYNIEEKLFSVFGAKQKILNAVTYENLEPFFAKQHCSVNKHFLNTETEAQLKGITQD